MRELWLVRCQILPFSLWNSSFLCLCHLLQSGEVTLVKTPGVGNRFWSTVGRFYKISAFCLPDSSCSQSGFKIEMLWFFFEGEGVLWPNGPLSPQRKIKDRSPICLWTERATSGDDTDCPWRSWQVYANYRSPKMDGFLCREPISHLAACSWSPLKSDGRGRDQGSCTALLIRYMFQNNGMAYITGHCGFLILPFVEGLAISAIRVTCRLLIY